MPGPLEPPAPCPRLGGFFTRPQPLQPWELPSASAGAEIPAWSQHTPSCLERPKMSRKWARVWEMHQVCTHGTVLRTPGIWGGARALELLGLDTRARTLVWIWTRRYRDRHRCCNSANTASTNITSSMYTTSVQMTSSKMNLIMSFSSFHQTLPLL